ncbi:zinc ribbon domain-containing protein [Synechococcus sp. A15-28]
MHDTFLSSQLQCLKCGHTENADVNAAKNILQSAMGE